MTDLTMAANESLPIEEFTEKAYLDYAMTVILDRALPHIGDGLKPVQRRILYAMSDLGLKSTAKYKKSARTVGDVLGKFHPHGDSACYEAMVHLAQPFSQRYPLVDGQGNWGSMDDPKSFAAMRYTESRLAKFSEVYLSELHLGTVEWQPNFDATLQEPKTLPARLPTLLLNGVSGIAVGMATDIPPHNLNEVVEALKLLIDKPKATLADICKLIPAPDFPTKAEIITPKAEIKRIYETGNGSLRQRATYRVEKENIIIEEIPYQSSGTKILTQIAKQMTDKKLPMVVDLRDESDQENPVRLVVVAKSSKVEIEPLMQHLFASTDLEKSFRVNMNVIGLNGRPKVKNLLQILTEWLEFRKQTVRNRLNYRLEKILTRLHILEGLLVAFLNIDEVIAIIRKYDDAKAKLVSKFTISEEQADAILDLKLRHLAKLEEQKIKGEQKELAEERKMLEQLLGSEARLKTLIKKELVETAKTFGDDRRSPLIERSQAQALDPDENIPQEPVTVILSQKGWVKAAKGHEVTAQNLQYKSGDGFAQALQAQTDQSIVFVDQFGRCYTALANQLPSAGGFGEPLSIRFQIPSGALISGCFALDDQAKLILMASSGGYGFIAPATSLVTRNKNGKACIKVPSDTMALRPIVLSSTKKLRFALINKAGYLLVIESEAVPQLEKGKGNKLMAIHTGEDEALDRIVPLFGDAKLQLVVGKKSKKLSAKDLDHYAGERGTRGRKLPRGFQSPDDIIVL